ncbi:glycosyltransferase [Lutimonas halocynthiae]|uniref:glycosyltransferase n=1 Tax=Lutimonas halocynthiae TaxID=1446477 RepID=UPI0025B58B28|nr:glycosyltransferase [Lutimonas halocynthiae]MDN3641071.1 glycosyltransferase [Lutimonas halocynthiae]
MKPRIVFFLPNLNGGGAERVSVNYLRQLNSKNFEIFLILVKKNGDLLELIPKEIKIFELNSKSIITTLMSFKKIILKLNPDVLYSTLYRTNIAIYLTLIMGVSNVKVVLRSPNLPSVYYKNNNVSYIFKLFLKLSFRRADLIIAQTDEMKIDLISVFNLNSNKIKVLMNPIDKKLIEEQIEGSHYPYEKGFVNVIAAGRIVYEKGFDVLIHSFKSVIEKNDRFRLYILGNDFEGYQNSLQHLINVEGLNDYIYFLGFKKDSFKYYFHSDLFVLSSRNEGMPNVVLENLYLNKPIIATKCLESIAKLIKDGKNGILVEVEDEVSMAEAILNYKIIDVNYNTMNFENDIIDKVFTGLVKN